MCFVLNKSMATDTILLRSKPKLWTNVTPRLREVGLHPTLLSLLFDTNQIRASRWYFQDESFKVIFQRWDFRGESLKVRASRSIWDFQDEAFKKRFSRWAFQDYSFEMIIARWELMISHWVQVEANHFSLDPHKLCERFVPAEFANHGTGWLWSSTPAVVLRNPRPMLID